MANSIFENTVTKLSQDTLSTIDKALAKQIPYYEAYLAITKDLKAQGYSDAQTLYWFEQAANINSNGTLNTAADSANVFIRAVTIFGLKIDSKQVSPESVQKTSNDIAVFVLKGISEKGGTTNVANFLNADISTALSKAGQTIGGWGGAFYYWDKPFKSDYGNTVGDAIRNSPAEYEKFLAVTAAATVAVLKHEWKGASDIGDIEFENMYDGFDDSTVPPEVKADIVQRVQESMVHGYSGNPDVIGDYVRTDDGRWALNVAGLGNIQYADAETSKVLDDRRDARLKIDAVEEELEEDDPHLTEDMKKRLVNDRCFAAGTFIDMADGTQKPIETIEVGDEVLAYDPDTTDGLGALKPARVARTITNFVDEIIDFHGVNVTPGHATLCADGPNKGHHIPLMDIIREDGVIADRDGTLIRAATNLAVGSAGDQMVQVAYLLDKSQQTYFKGEMRLGTLMLGEDGREDWRVMDALAREGYQVFDDGLIAKDGEIPHPLYWFGAVPKPEDYILKKSKLALADLYAANGELKSGAPTHAGMTVQ